MRISKEQKRYFIEQLQNAWVTVSGPYESKFRAEQDMRYFWQESNKGKGKEYRVSLNSIGYRWVPF